MNGKILFTPPPRAQRAFMIANPISCLHSQVDDEIQIFGSEFGLTICREPLTCRSPDVAVFERTKMVVGADGFCWSGPGLIVEVVSATETEQRKREKVSDYARIGVPEVWIVSPEAESVEIRLLRDGKLPVASVIVEGQLRPTQFPDVAIPIAETWPEYCNNK